MSNAAQRNRASAKQIKPHKQQNPKKIVAIIIITILVAIPFCMGKYFEFNFPDPYDSGANVYSAKHILDGARIGIEEKPSAALGTLLVNILGVWVLGFNEFGPKLIQAIFQAGALVLMFVAMRKLFGTLAAAVGVIITSVYLSAPLIAKFGNVKEQYMIACMVMGISCFVLYQLGGKYRWAILAGVFLSWAPLFKETGTSALGAIALFVALQPVFKHRTFKQTGIDVLLLTAGAVITIAPLYVWIIGWDVQMALPYSSMFNIAVKALLPAEELAKADSYVTASRKLVPFAKQWPRVLRYYGLLILPIILAIGAIAARIARMICRIAITQKIKTKPYERFVLLFTVWWLLDTAFVWISPRSYEQYYLPLNASAAMLAGYLIAVYADAYSTSQQKIKWGLVGAAGLVCITVMSWHIFFGIKKSPHSGIKYPNKRRGYAQMLDEISTRRKNNLKMPWEHVGEYILNNSTPSDKIYVWGWYPGIYIKAQRFSSATTAFMMPRPAPDKMREMIAELITEFETEKPKFIVDTHKRHIPMERPPFELWPIIPKGFMGAQKAQFLPLNKNIIAQYDRWWSEELRKRFDADEAHRYKEMQPFREFVMKNYKIVRIFGQHVLFQLKDSPSDKEQQ